MICNINSIGKHYIFDIYNCSRKKIEYQNTVEKFLNKLVNILQLSKVNESYKQFEPVGVTGFILLEESHVSIHTWPEYEFAAVDVFSCKDSIDLEKVKKLIATDLESSVIEINSLKRGKALDTVQET